MAVSIWGDLLHHRANRRRRMRARWAEYAPRQYILPFLVGRITYALSLYRLSLVIFGCLGGGSCVSSGRGGRLGGWRIHGKSPSLEAVLHESRCVSGLARLLGPRSALGRELVGGIVVARTTRRTRTHAHTLDCITPLNTLSPVLFRTIILCTTQPALAPVLLQPTYLFAQPGHCCSILIESHLSSLSGAGNFRPLTVDATLFNPTIQLSASVIQPLRIALTWS